MGGCASRVWRKSAKDEMVCLSPIEKHSKHREDRELDAGEEKDRSAGKGKEVDEDHNTETVEELEKRGPGKTEWHKEEVKRHSLRNLFEENDEYDRPNVKDVDVEPSESSKLETSTKINNDETPVEEKSSSETKEVEMAESNRSASGTEVTAKSGSSGEFELKVMDVKISDEEDKKEVLTELKIKPEEGTVEPEAPKNVSMVEEVKEGMTNLKDGLKALIFGHDATVIQTATDSTLPTETLVDVEKEKEREVVKDVKIEETTKEVESAEKPSKN